MGEIIVRLLLCIYWIIMWALHNIFYVAAKIKHFETDYAKDFERFGLYNQNNTIIKQIKGKEVWWFNCASAGEFNAIKKLIKEIDSSRRFIVITTTTESGAEAFSYHKHTTNNIAHCYAPYDTPQAISGFLRFWKPTKIILVESEIWPNLILMGSCLADLYIVNGRLSPKSFKRWSKVSWLLRYILKYVKLICASSESDFDHYIKFHDDVHLTGNLKYDAGELDFHPIHLQQLRNSVGDRPVFICASTHQGEEEILIKVYKQLLELSPDLLLILAPRHKERGNELSKLCFNNKLTSVLRDQDSIINNYIPAGTNVYIMNTIGELGIAFRLGKIVFMGGSINDVGGHNCCEPAILECAIISGTNMSNFIDLKNGMIRANAIIIATTELEVFQSVKILLNNPEDIKKFGKNAKQYVVENGTALRKTLDCLLG